MKKGDNVIVRSSQSGVWHGKLVGAEPQGDFERVMLSNARRIWYWTGATSCSGLAAHGPRDGKIAAPVEVVVSGVCERIRATNEADKRIAAITEWRP